MARTKAAKSPIGGQKRLPPGVPGKAGAKFPEPPTPPKTKTRKLPDFAKD